jgi:hypothetical protein
LRGHMDAERQTHFWDRVDKAGPEGCWLWTSTVRRDSGYGQYVIEEWKKPDGTWTCRTARAHRVAYEIAVGPIPDGMTIDHLCKVKHCVNPQHMEVVTPEENARRGNTRRGGLCKAGLHVMEGDNLIFRPSRSSSSSECRACTNERRRRTEGRRHR